MPGQERRTTSATSRDSSNTSGRTSTSNSTTQQQAPTTQPTVATGSGADQSAAVTTGIGANVDALVNRSELLRTTIQDLQSNGWTITTGTAGAGTFADRSTKRIVLDPNGVSDPAGTVQSIAHEAGHAAFTPDPYIDFGSLTREQYVEQNTGRDLRDESEATIMNLQVREQLNTGDSAVDIGVAGAQSAEYQRLYGEFQAGNISRSELVDAIASQFSSGERPSTDPTSTYGQYYGSVYASHWDTHHP